MRRSEPPPVAPPIGAAVCRALAVMLLCFGPTVTAEPGDSAACRDALAHGLEALERGDAEDAARRYALAAEVAPSDAYRSSALVGLGTSLSILGRHGEAVEAFGDAHALVPGDVDVLILLGGAEREASRLSVSRRHLEDAVRRAPERPAVHRELGLTLTAAGEFEEAAASCRTAAELSPGSVPTWLCVGVASYQARQMAAAVAAFATAVELSPDDPRARYGYGQALVAAGRRSEATEQYVQLRSLDPELAADLYTELFPDGQ